MRQIVQTIAGEWFWKVLILLDIFSSCNLSIISLCIFKRKLHVFIMPLLVTFSNRKQLVYGQFKKYTVQFIQKIIFCLCYFRLCNKNTIDCLLTKTGLFLLRIQLTTTLSLCRHGWVLVRTLVNFKVSAFYFIFMQQKVKKIASPLFY